MTGAEAARSRKKVVVAGSFRPTNTLHREDPHAHVIGAAAFVQSKQANALGLGRDDSRRGAGSLGPPQRRLTSSSEVPTQPQTSPKRLHVDPSVHPYERRQRKETDVFDLSEDNGSDSDVFSTSRLPRIRPALETGGKKMTLTNIVTLASSIAEPEERRSSSFMGIVGTVSSRMVSGVKGMLYGNSQAIDITSGPEEEAELDIEADPPTVAEALSAATKHRVNSIMYPDEGEEPALPKRADCLTQSSLPGTGRVPRFPVAAIVAGEVMAEVNSSTFLRGGSAHVILKGTEMLLEFSQPDMEVYMHPIQSSDFRVLAYGKSKDSASAAFLDLYLNDATAHCQALKRVGFPGDAVDSRLTNIRLFVTVGPEEWQMDNLTVCCSYMHTKRYQLDDDGYEAMRPPGHFNELERTRAGQLPYSASRRSTRAGTGGTKYSWLDPRPTRPRTTTSTYSARRARTDDGDVVICQPRVPSRGELLFVYPEDSPDSLHMTTVERARLQPGVYLNDNNIDFELRRMYETMLTAEQQQRTLVFNCFFYKRLSAPRAREETLPAYERVRTWTRERNIFDLDQLLIPINEALHWYLAIIVNPGYLLEKALERQGEEPTEGKEEGPSQKDIFDVDTADSTTPAFKPGEEGDPDRLKRTYIIILDSLFNNRTNTMTRLKSYLVHEGRAKLGLELDSTLIRGMTIKEAPRQDNLTDCGCFLLQYAEEAFQHLDSIRPQLILQEHAWFSLEVAKGRRGRMLAVMDEMAAQYKAAHPDMHQVIDLGNSSDIEEIATID